MYQIVIILLLSAVITGSLLTGYSVKESLRKTSAERLGKTKLLVSTGLRLFSDSLSYNIQKASGLNCTGLLEMTGYSRNMISQKEVPGTHIYSIGKSFFRFHGIDTLILNQNDAAINKKLADFLELKVGDEIILRYNKPTDIAADAPFAPSGNEGESVVMRVKYILGAESAGNFSLSINQVVPYNVFIGSDNSTENSVKEIKVNRLLISDGKSSDTAEIFPILKKSLKVSDIGLRIRRSEKGKVTEIISDRVFIDKSTFSAIKGILPQAEPLLTYLGNKFTSRSRSTPYSFISALPNTVYPEIPSGNGVVINRWLADDLEVKENDTIKISWYSPDSLNKLIERDKKFIITAVTDFSNRISDSLLMPEFPGIARSESCSGWDAGVPVKVGEIRDKDEEYWNHHKGTPKAFISYQTGLDLWGNNFGPATAIRFPNGFSVSDVQKKLDGKLNPYKTGFSITDLKTESEKAAGESTDFGTLFISLGFFLIVAAIVLLSFSVSAYFESKQTQIRTLFALGFSNRNVNTIFLSESVLISFLGSFAGAFAGLFVNIIITVALNSVWTGAVQTNTLRSYFSMLPVMTGFLSTFIIAIILVEIKLFSYLKKLNKKKSAFQIVTRKHTNLVLLVVSSFLSIVLFIASLLLPDSETSLSFAAGVVLFLALILLWRQIILTTDDRDTTRTSSFKTVSGLYFKSNPNSVVSPVLFIAAGIFAVFITGANKMSFDGTRLKRSDGTGGYLLWCETSVPVKEDLTTPQGRKAFGFDEELFKQMNVIQVKRQTGDDASCLNLNHVSVPAIIGLDPEEFIKNDAFAFARRLPDKSIENTWEFLDSDPERNTIYGIADQTVS